jgi:quercetin dioxygenase-like cupin family protein
VGKGVTVPFLELEDLETREPMPDFKGKFVHSDHLSVADWSIEAGAPFPEHSHPHEQISIVVSGEFELTLDGETRILKPGVVAIIPGDVPHSGKALTACKVIDVFHPVREDYR